MVTADGCVHIAESVGSRRELRIHVHIAAADATRQNSFVASASAVCIGLNAVYRQLWCCQNFLTGVRNVMGFTLHKSGWEAC